MRRTAFLVPVALALFISAAAAQEASPGASGAVFPIEPDPAECTVEPRPREFFEQYVGTPTAEQATAMAADATPPPGFRMPDGEPADEATVAAVLDTVRMLGACVNAGDFFGRYGALFTEESLARQFEESGPLPEADLAFLDATPQPLPADGRVALLAVVDVRTLPDGRVAGLFDVRDPFAETPGPARFYWEFVEEDGRWLIDEEVMLGPIEPGQVGTPTA